MTLRKQAINKKRRRFIKGSAIVGAGAAVAAGPAASLAASDELPQEKNSKQEGYQLSAHVLKYYQTVSS